MKKIIILILVLVVLAAGLIFSYHEMSKERAMEMQGEAPVIPESRVKRFGADIVVTLDAETQERVGLKTGTPAATNLSAEMIGYGRVLDPAPLAAAFLELAPGEAALATSRKELERVKTLRAQDNASARVFEAAELAVKREELAVEASRTRLELAWGKAVMERKDLAAFIRTLITREVALLRVDLPAGQSLTEAPARARFVALTDSSAFVEGQFLAKALDVNPQTQGQGFLFLVTNAATSLAPGAAITAFLPTSSAARTGVIIPRDAVLRADGKASVYVQTGAETFVRREIVLDHPVLAGWFVTQTFAVSEKLVLVGAQALLSEELKAQIPKMAD